MIEATTTMVKEGKQIEVSSGSWAGQFKDALNVNGGDDDDDGDPPTTFDWVMHIITVPWKLLFAVIPPPEWHGAGDRGHWRPRGYVRMRNRFRRLDHGHHLRCPG